MDVSGRISREADKVSQLIARTKAFGPRARIYMECTVSVEEGRTWQEYIGGTHSRIALPCPHCSAWVTPEREHLVGWQEATTQLEARETGLFSCPECQEVWNESQRIEANFHGQLLHDGQSMVDGVVQGSPPATDTLGFRWSAVNNMFLSSGEIAGDEWKASRAVDEENADRERRQFVWCLPVIPNKWSEVEIQEQEITSRVTDLPRGIVPVGCQHLTAAIDLGKYLNHWVLVAWTEGPFAHVVDYGRIEVASDSLGVEAATMNALRQFRDLAKAGWPIGAAGGELRHIDFTMVDAGYQTDVVYAFTRESGKHFVPSVGRGAGQQHAQYASRVTTTGSTTVHVGDSFPHQLATGSRRAPPGTELRPLEDLGAAAAEDASDQPWCHDAVPGIDRRTYIICQASNRRKEDRGVYRRQRRGDQVGARPQEQPLVRCPGLCLRGGSLLRRTAGSGS